MTNDELASAIQHLMSGGRDATVRWEREAFDHELAATGPNVVLFGAGGLGRRSLTGLRCLGIEPLAFADNNPALWGGTVQGVPVLSVPDAAARYGSSALFVISIWRAAASSRIGDHYRQLLAYGCIHITTFGPLFFRCADDLLPHYALDLPHKVFDHAADVTAACYLWADDRSKGEYLAQVRWRLTLDFNGLPDPDCSNAYFPPNVFRLRSDEVYVDCGAYDGDTLDLFLSRAITEFRRFIAFEPDAENFKKLGWKLSSLPDALQGKVRIYPNAVGDRAGPISFTATGGPSSVAGAGTGSVECVRLDVALAGESPTIVKMDIEGGEPAALAGLKDTIHIHRPVLAISAYHSQDHLWSIPIQIQAIAPDYRFFLRPHNLEVWDTVCYAVPPDRVVS